MPRWDGQSYIGDDPFSGDRVCFGMECCAQGAVSDFIYGVGDSPEGHYVCSASLNGFLTEAVTLAPGNSLSDR